ncbi:MAG TPA: ABC transporter substrate-binding protein [Steroidobacteraceae bacterium]|jgi:iron complex transport system substrate-binding protein|nr:ABC transporter substrate-binding protein [Steroidobacteraceae bacterium]
MSLSLCTDALVLELLPPARITSVTYLAHRSTDPALAAAAARVGINYGTSEEVLSQAPDLVLAGVYSTPAARMLLRQLHAPLLVVPAATSFADIRMIVRRVASALAVQQRGEALLAQMDETLAAVRRARPAQPIRVAAWSGDGYVPGRGTLFNAVLQAAGGINVAANTPGERSGSFDIEQLLLAHPEVLAYGADRPAPALQTQSAEHPLLRRLYANRRITYPQLPLDCGLPQSAAAAQALQNELLAVIGAPAHSRRSPRPPDAQPRSRPYGGPP